MTRRVTKVYGISSEVPFLNVDVDNDNELFLDPSAIRNGTDQYAIKAHQQLVDFFTKILSCARSTDPLTLRKGELLLQRMHEPNETRLGYSTKGSRGHGFADEMGSRLWEEITLNRTVQTGTGRSTSIQDALLARLERVPLFVKDVGEDMISDLTTRVVFNVLSDFTADMVITYPSLSNGATTAPQIVWDSGASDLVETEFLLPTIDGKQLLLVPKHWVYWRLVMAPEAFYNRYSTQVIQDEQTTYTSGGKANKPSKMGIKSNNKDIKGTNIRESVKYAEEHNRNLPAEYEAEIDGTFEPLSDERIEHYLKGK